MKIASTNPPEIPPINTPAKPWQVRPTRADVPAAKRVPRKDERVEEPDEEDTVDA